MRLGAEIAGRYRLIQGPISGGMGEVWLARDQELERNVALKRTLTGDDAAAFRRLQAEARALALFNHPHVVTLYDAVRSETRGRSTCWLVMEFVPGGSLADAPPLTPKVAASIGAQIADALAALHAEGIVHCDIKPGNIVISGKGTAKLTDFGAVYRTAARKTMTPNDAISHTPGFAAPEVLARRPEPASDVFSLGVTVRALIAGSGHHAAGTSPDTGPLAEILERMLRLDPAERPDPAEVRRLLKAVAGDAMPPPLVHRVPTITGGSEARQEGGRPGEDGGGGQGAQGGPGGQGGRGGRGGHRQPRGPFWPAPAGLARRHPLVAVGATVAAVLVLAAASAALSGLGPFGEDDPQAAAPGTSRSLIDPPATADPCALVAPASFGRFGRIELDKHYGNFERCDVIVTSGKSEVDVKVEFAVEPPPAAAGRTRPAGRFRVLDEPLSGDECARTVLLPAPDTGTAVNVTAHETGEGRAPLCALADVAAADAAARLGRGPVARRPPAPAGSLLHRDACDLLGPRALDRVPGIDAAGPRVGFARWTCDWKSTTRDLQVQLRFDQGSPPGSNGGRSTRLGGYRAFVEREGDGDGTCVVRVVVRPVADPQARDATEMLYLTVRGDGPADRLCSLGTALAASAAADLPHA